MNRILKVFASGDEQKPLAEQYHVIERYDAFVLVEVPRRGGRRLAREFLVEDVTDLYAIPVAAGVIDTSMPRIDSDGTTRAHPAYRRAALAAGRASSLPRPVHRADQGRVAARRQARGRRAARLYANFTYVVRADEAALAKIAALPYVRWAGHLPHDDRIASSVRSSSRERPRRRCRARGCCPTSTPSSSSTPTTSSQARPEVRKLGVKVLHRGTRRRSCSSSRRADKKAERQKQLKALSAVHGVRKIRQRAIKRPSNDVAAGIMGTATAMGNPGLGLSGKGETIAVCDTGLDTGDPATIHPDFAGRVACDQELPDHARLRAVRQQPRRQRRAGRPRQRPRHPRRRLGARQRRRPRPRSRAGPPDPRARHNAKLVFQAVEQEMQVEEPRRPPASTGATCSPASRPT